MTPVSFPNYSNSLLRFASQRGWSSRFKWLGERSASKWRSIWFLKVISHWKKCYRFSSLLYVVGITNYQQYRFFLMTSFRCSCPRLNHYQVKISSIVIVRGLQEYLDWNFSGTLLFRKLSFPKVPSPSIPFPEVYFHRVENVIKQLVHTSAVRSSKYEALGKFGEHSRS